MSLNLTDSRVAFSFETSTTLRERRKLKIMLARMFHVETKLLESLHYIFCSDEYLLKINQDYLKHDYYTDIITFELADKGMPTVGEIYISIDRVRDNAKTHETSYSNELLRVIFHGALHLCGYKDKSPKDAAKMRAAEEKWIEMFHVERY